MIHFERSTDYALIHRILTHPRIWPFISDDFSPPREQYQPVQHESIWYVVVHDQDSDPRGPSELLGLWTFIPQNGVCWDVHTALLPNAWGKRGQTAARMLPEWIWINTSCRRIITTVPSYNRLALHFAIRAGMRVYGVNEASYMKNNKLYDQVCLGISKPGILPDDVIDELVERQEQELETCR